MGDNRNTEENRRLITDNFRRLGDSGECSVADDCRRHGDRVVCRRTAAAATGNTVAFPRYPARHRTGRRTLRPHRLDRNDPLARLGQLRAGLRVRIEHGEVGHDDRNRKRYRQDARNGADGPDEHSDVRLGRHVAVPDGRHRDDGPPQSDRDRLEVVAGVVLDALGVVDERREDDDAEHQEEDEQRQLVSARLERVYEDFEAGRVARQLEEAHDADDAEELEDVVVDVHVVEDAVEHERQRRDDVDDVDRAADEVQARRADDHPHEDLEREPRVAHRLHVEERLVRLGRSAHQLPDGPVAGQLLRFVADHRDAQVRVCLEAERQDRNDDEEHGNERQNLKQSQSH